MQFLFQLDVLICSKPDSALFKISDKVNEFPKKHGELVIYNRPRKGSYKLSISTITDSGQQNDHDSCSVWQVFFLET